MMLFSKTSSLPYFAITLFSTYVINHIFYIHINDLYQLETTVIFVLCSFEDIILKIHVKTNNLFFYIFG